MAHFPHAFRAFSTDGALCLQPHDQTMFWGSIRPSVFRGEGLLKISASDPVLDEAIDPDYVRRPPASRAVGAVGEGTQGLRRSATASGRCP